MTWAGQPPPKAGESVIIPAGQNILYDLPASPVLVLIVVEGRLIFEDTQDVALDAHYIMVRYVPPHCISCIPTCVQSTHTGVLSVHAHYKLDRSILLHHGQVCGAPSRHGWDACIPTCAQWEAETALQSICAHSLQLSLQCTCTTTSWSGMSPLTPSLGCLHSYIRAALLSVCVHSLHTSLQHPCTRALDLCFQHASRI